jgi:acyl-coenzyme A synthetase/AMP-(fatty) acid ligase/thioesterase domain-containing protein
MGTERLPSAPAGAVPSIPEALAAQVIRHALRPAIIEGTRVLSYRELQELCHRGACALRERWPEGGCVAVLGEHAMDVVVALLAVLHADMTERLRALVVEAEAVVQVVDEALTPLAEALTGRGGGVLRLAEALNSEAEPANANTPRPRPDSPAFILFSSGTTGRPMGVLATHGTLVCNARSYAESAGLCPDDRLTLLARTQYAAGLSAIFGALLNGAVLLPFDVRTRGFRDMRDWMLESGPTIYHSIPTLFRRFCESLPPETRFPSLRIVKLGGEPVLGHDIRLWREHFPPDSTFINGLGLSEANGNLCHFKILGSVGAIPAVVPVGRPLPGVDIIILGDDGDVLPVGQTGEIAFRCAHRSPGYWRDGDWSSRLVPPPNGDGNAFFRTGDLGRFLPDGDLMHLGRKDDVIKLRGFRIEPGEIEANLLQHPAVAQAVVLLRTDDPENPRLFAYWVPKAPGPSNSSNTATNTAATAEQLCSFLTERLPSHMVPAAFVDLEALPLTPSGKLDRKALQAPSLSGDLQQRVPPCTALQIQLHAIWAEVLGHADFGIPDNFFAIGGHSLAAARQIARIEQTLGAAPPLATIFHAPTIAQMALLLQEQKTLSSAIDMCLVPLQTLGEATPLFVIHGYGGDVFCYTEFARALAPDRPVFGLQAQGIDGHAPPHRSVEEMAEHYASLIQARWPQGPYHLLGQSAGGWYAYAVAAALLNRGGSIGMLAILDSGPSAFIAKRLRASLLLRRTLLRFPIYLEQLLHSKRPRSFAGFLRLRFRNLAAQLQRFRTPATNPLQEPDNRAAPTAQDYYDLLHRGFRPQPLPLTIHLFTTPDGERMKHRLWRAHACGGVHHRILFEEHYHYHLAPWAADLAAAIRDTLEEVEAEQGGGAARSSADGP